MSFGRRAFLSRAVALATASFLRPSFAAPEKVRFTDDPFALGIASGSPRDTSVVLWTRLAPKPLEGGGLDPVGVDVRWEIAHDEKFSRIARSGTSVADPERAHAVHVECDGLEPGRVYHYRFIAGGAVSAVGRTRTAPAPGKGDERLRVILASCQQYEQGYFAAHRHIAAEDPDLIAFVGDYIYESSWGREHVRKHATGEPHTLAEYRARYAQYKSDPDLQLAHRVAPWIVTWDDHEVDNDYAADRSEDLDPDFLARRTAAYRAFFEHHPLRASTLLDGMGIRIFDRFAWGNLALFHVLDDRQYRSYQSCPKPGRGGGNIVGAECTALRDPDRTLLGEAQERWLGEGLARSSAKWNLLTQQTLFVPATRRTEAGPKTWTDGWDGYPAARERLLTQLSDGRAANPVILGGDVHCGYVANVHANARPDSRVVAAEFCATSITSQGPSVNVVQGILGLNKHMRYGNPTQRGYTRLDLTRERLEARMRVIETPKRADAAVSTDATFYVEAGKPGLVR
ncbi:hypothetical protein BWI17_11990 [Betaproteobacteria bacterium GR16-43]|nr:hypothetical protein BWI17_11990 [Betaproteobacteria bacterium GR16-43]